MKATRTTIALMRAVAKKDICLRHHFYKKGNHLRIFDFDMFVNLTPSKSNFEMRGCLLCKMRSSVFFLAISAKSCMLQASCEQTWVLECRAQEEQESIHAHVEKLWKVNWCHNVCLLRLAVSLTSPYRIIQYKNAQSFLIRLWKNKIKKLFIVTKENYR